MADNKIQGRAKKFDGTAIDYVSIFNWLDGKCIAQVNPNASGDWQYTYSKDLKVGLTYVANGCEPITHGAYDFDYVYNPLLETILHYSFNGNVLDQSVNNLNGIKTGVANFVAGRKVGTQALEFVAGCVRTPIALPINSDKMTISFWMSTDQKIDSGVVFELSENSNTNSYSFNVFLNDINQGKLQSLSRNEVTAINIVEATPVFDNVFQHVIVEVDRTKPALEEQKIYIDNVLASTQISDHINNSSGNFTNYTLYIGQRNASSAPFVGKLQDVRVYNRVLTSDERLALFNE